MLTCLFFPADSNSDATFRGRGRPASRYNEIDMANARYAVILEPEADGGYSVHCPSLPGCVAQGDTREDTLDAVRAAISQSLMAWEEDGMAPPADSVDYLGDELYEILAARSDDSLPLTCETVEVEVDIGEREQSGDEPERPPVLTVPEVPGTGALKRGALKALIRHSGMSPEEFELYVKSESRMTEAMAAMDGRRIELQG